jgi:AmmeMemoRadiSam system protein B
MSAREPAAGIWGFYPLDRDLLVKSIERCFLDEDYGPGKLPSENKAGLVHGGIAPHAGYTYSGPCAAHLYLELAESHVDFDTLVIIGTNHTGIGGDLTTTSAYVEWVTPLGNVPVDIEAVKELVSTVGIADDRYAHEREHSVEVQLPFAQYALGRGWKLVPIVAKPFTPEKAKVYGTGITRVLEELGRKPLFIVSSDFTHHGPSYGYVLFTVDPISKVRDLDLAFISRITSLDIDGFYRMVEEYNATICGWPAIMVLMEIARMKRLGFRLLKYYNSGELTGDPSVIVGYASISMEKT